MKEQTIIQNYLQETFHQIKAKNPNYSVRAFAKRAGIAPGTMSLIMLGKRNVSHKLARKISDNLMLDPQKRSEIMASYPGQLKRKKQLSQQTQNYLQINRDQFNLIGDWHFFAILSLINLKTFRDDIKWISKRLSLSQHKVKQSLETLKRLGMITEENGKLRRSASKYRTTDDVANLALRKSHFQNLELANKSLEKDSVKDRDFSWITFNMKKENMPKAKELIRKFQDDFMDLVEDEQDGDEVFRMAIQLFQLSKNGGN